MTNTERIDCHAKDFERNWIEFDTRWTRRELDAFDHATDATMFDKDDGYPGTAPVGSFVAGATKLGVNDMVGNVWEWTHDRYASYSKEDQVDPMGASEGNRRAIRGGAFNGAAALWVNPAYRFHQLETATSHAIGFRCATTP